MNNESSANPGMAIEVIRRMVFSSVGMTELAAIWRTAKSYAPLLAGVQQWVRFE